jgi:hypothetical protein
LSGSFGSTMGAIHRMTFTSCVFYQAAARNEPAQQGGGGALARGLLPARIFVTPHQWRT